MRMNDEGLPCGECFVIFATEAAMLAALERNVGVPRDMAAQPAGAMRAACALIASGLDVAATEAAAAGA